jgi:hypothetical protein
MSSGSPLVPTSTSTIPAATLGIDYSDLYRRWEKGHWLATEIDFTQDQIDWREKMTPAQRRTAMWFFSLFFHGEDSVTDDLSPYIAAAPTEEQTYFLTTQQVDEARHSVFFQRFFHEVAGLGDGTPGSGLTATGHQLTWGHRKMFRHLDQVAARLSTDHSPAMFAEALTMYHVIVEGTLAQPGQHMLEAWLTELDVLPGFREGLARVSADEQRHIAFGVKALSELYAAHPADVGEAIVGAFISTAQWLAAFAYPPGGDRSYVEALDRGLDELFSDSISSALSKLKAVGLSPELRARALPLDPTADPRDHGVRLLTLLDAGYLGDGTLPKDHADGPVDLFLEAVRWSANTSAIPAGSVVQFAFTDVTPRYMEVTPEGTRISRGLHPAPSATLRIALDDLLDMTGQRVSPVTLVLRRRLKVSGSRRLLIGPNSLFAGATAKPPGLRGRVRTLIGA